MVCFEVWSEMAAEEEGIELAVVDVEEGLDAEAQKKVF